MSIILFGLLLLVVVVLLLRFFERRPRLLSAAQTRPRYLDLSGAKARPNIRRPTPSTTPCMTTAERNK